ncbi:WD40 repeat domain-containing protein [Nocardia sp. NPDC004722]
MNELMGPTRGPGAKGLEFQRFSDWKNGKALPAKFASVWPVLKVLIDRTDKATAPVPPELVRKEYWLSLYLAAKKWVPQSTCPYPGLAAYQTGDADRFFGRNRAIQELTALVRSIDAGGGGIGLLVGASGSGKSSLLAAGLIPALPAEWSSVWCTPTVGLNEALAEAGRERCVLIVDQFEELFAAAFGAQERDEVLDQLKQSATAGTTVIVSVRSDFLASCLEAPVLAEALSGATEPGADTGIEARPAVAVTATIRHCVVLRRPLIDELKDVIVGPARRAGVELEEGLSDLIIADLGQLAGNDDVGTLPLLSHVMAAVWDKHSGRNLTIAAYIAAGRVASSVTQTAEAAWKQLDDDARAAAQHLLIAMVAVGDGTRDTRRRLPLKEAAHAADAAAATSALDSLATARLITVEEDHATLIHEVVLDAWPRLREWIDADRDALLVRRRTEADAAEWEASDRSTALLYRGTRLARARSSHPSPGGAGARFLAAAIRAQRWRIAAVAATATSLVVILVVALVLNVQASSRERELQVAFLARVLQEIDQQQSTDPTLAAQLAVLAFDNKRDDPGVRSRLIASQMLPVAKTFTNDHQRISGIGYLSDGTLAVAGYDGDVRVWRVDEAGPAALVARLAGNKAQITALMTHQSTVIAACADNAVRIYDRSNSAWPQPVSTFDTGSPVTFAALSHDGRTLAVAHASGVELWDVSSLGHAVQIPVRVPVEGSPFVVAFTGTDNALLTTSSTPSGALGIQYTTTAWPLDLTRDSLQGAIVTVQPDKPLVRPSDTTPLLAVGEMGVRPDSPYPGQSTVEFYSLDNPADPKKVTAPFPVAAGQYLRGFGFGDGDRLFATVSVTGVSLWNLADRTKPTPLGIALTGTSAACSAPGGRCSGTVVGAMFAPDGRHGAVALDDGTVEHWSLPTGVLVGQAGQIGSLTSAIGANGHRMITSAPGQDAHVWDLSNLAAARIVDTIPRPDYRVSGITQPVGPAMSPDGRYVAVLQSGEMTLLDMNAAKDNRVVRTFPGAFGIGFAADRPLLAAAFADPIPHLEIWDYSQPGNMVHIDDSALQFKNRKQFLPLLGVQTAVSRSGNAVVGLTDLLQVWDPRSAHPGTLLGMTDPDRAEGSGLAVSSDGKTAAIGWRAGRIQFWDISNPHHIVPLATPLPVTSNVVGSVDFSPSGTRLAVGGSDGTVQLVDMSTPTAPSIDGRSLTTPDENVWNVAFLDDSHLLAGGRDGALRIWDLDPDNARKRVCALTGATILARLEAEFPRQTIENPCR